jgi:hypothetical protein
MIILDSKKNIKDIFEEIMKNEKYEYDVSESRHIKFTMILGSTDEPTIDSSRHIYTFEMDEDYNFKYSNNITKTKYSCIIPNY